MIDAHQHFWRYSSTTHAWIDASMSVLKRDFLPADVKPLLDANGVRGCIAVQASQTLEETRFLLDLAREHAWIRGVVGWVDLADARVDAKLELLASDRRLVGIRHVAQDEPDPRFLVRSDIVRGIAAVGARGLAYDVLVREPQWSAALELVRALPDVRFVLDHLGKPPIRARRFDAWREWLREIAGEPNVVAKISGLLTESHWNTWKHDDLGRFVDTAIDAFGPSRSMIGSDWPVCLLAASYAEALDVVRARLGTLAPLERAGIESQTACRTYRLDDET